MSRGKYSSVPKGIPALVLIATGEKIMIGNKSYSVLKLQYDINGEYMPYASFIPR